MQTVQLYHCKLESCRYVKQEQQLIKMIFNYTFVVVIIIVVVIHEMILFIQHFTQKIFF